MDLRSVYIANGTGIFLLILLSYTSRTRIHARRFEGRLFSFMIVGVMLGCFMEALSYTVDGKMFPGARFLNYLSNSYLYFVNLLLPFSVLIYVDLGLYGDPGRIRKHYRPQIIIGVIMFSFNLLNFFFPISFYITEQNVYERRPFGYLYYVVILYYCLTGLIVTRRFEKRNGAKTFFNIWMFLVPIVAGVVLQSTFYGLSLAWLSAAIGLTGLFMMQQNEQAYIDSLVNTYNRQYLNHICSGWIRQGKSFAGVMLDIDRFKSINDIHGHSAGDDALKTVAEILKQSRKDQEWVFRFAGDEFIVLKMALSADALLPYMSEVNRRIAEYNREDHPYPLALSYGMSVFYPGQGDLDGFMKEMDANMYEMKTTHHGAEGR